MSSANTKNKSDLFVATTLDGENIASNFVGKVNTNILLQLQNQETGEKYFKTSPSGKKVNQYKYMTGMSNTVPDLNDNIIDRPGRNSSFKNS